MAEYDRDEILSQMLSGVPDTLDKREGGVIYSTLAPVATALSSGYYLYGNMNNLLFADTAENEWLDRVTNDFGVKREPATQSIRQIHTYDRDSVPFDVPIGSRFALRDITLTTTKKTAAGQFEAVCDQYGTVGNQYSGTILPVDNINGLGRAELVSAPLIPARDKESDEELRSRFYGKFTDTAFGGNKADYRAKVLAIDGVGTVEVFGAPELSQPGHVGLIIGNEQGGTASQTLIDTVQAAMGTNGDGLAPIGHTVTVATSTNLPINVTASVVLKSGTSFETVKADVETAIKQYIKAIGFSDQTVFWAKLVGEILNSNENIMDVGTVTMNDASGNIALSKTFALYQVPTVGTVTVSEAV